MWIVCSDLSRKLHAVIDNRGGGEEGLQSVWDTLDSDKSGYVTRNQFRHGLSELDLQLTDKQIHRLFRSIESGATGKLSERDFRGLVFLNDALPPRQPPPVPPKAKADDTTASAKTNADAKSKDSTAIPAAAAAAAGVGRAAFKFARCFGGLQVDCMRCGKSVQINKCEEHAQACALNAQPSHADTTSAGATGAVYVPIWRRPPPVSAMEKLQPNPNPPSGFMSDSPVRPSHVPPPPINAAVKSSSGSKAEGPTTSLLSAQH